MPPTPASHVSVRVSLQTTYSIGGPPSRRGTGKRFTHAGVNDGASFSQKNSPPMSSGKRLNDRGRLRRCGRIVLATAL
jgi:hypothetical protein